MAICAFFFKCFSFSQINCDANSGPFIPGPPLLAEKQKAPFVINSLCINKLL